MAWHGLLTAIAVLVGVLIAALLVRTANQPDLTEDRLYTVALFAIPGGVMGARVLHVLDKIDYYVAHPGSILAFQEGGLSLFGAIIGGTAAGVAAALVMRLPLRHLADQTAPGIILAQAVGRIGCTINGDAYGTSTSLPWGLLYTHPDAYSPPGHVGHPAAVYEIFWDLLVFGVLWRWRRSRRPEGSTFLLYACLYSLGRFFISFVRADAVVWAGLQQAHILSLLVVAVGAPLLWVALRQGMSRPVAVPSR